MPPSVASQTAATYPPGEATRKEPVNVGLLVALDANGAVTEVTVEHHERLHGSSKFGPARFWRGFLDLVTVKFLTTYTARPFSVPDFALGERSGADAGSIRLADADSYFKGLGADWAGKRVVVLRTDGDFLSSSGNVYRNDFWVDAPEWVAFELVLHLLPFRAKLRRQCPPDLVTRTLFPGMP